MTREQICKMVEEDARGLCCCDYISRKECMNVIKNVNDWVQTAQDGDIYYYNNDEYKLTIEYALRIYKNADVRESGDPLYATPISSVTNLQAIKKEVETYIIENTGCIEIIDSETEEAVLIYEKNEWHEVS